MSRRPRGHPHHRRRRPRRARRRPPACSPYPRPPSSAAAGSTRSSRPRLVTVDTPTRADKERLQTLGLDLTEHAGHDYVEVVLHTPADLTALTAAGFTYDVRIPDLIARGLEVAELNEAYAASVAAVPAAVGPRRLPHPRRLQRRHGGAGEEAPAGSSSGSR